MLCYVVENRSFLIEAEDGRKVVFAELLQFGTARCISDLGGCFVWDTCKRSHNADNQKEQEMGVIPEVDYRTSAEQDQASGSPASKHASAIILLSHLEAAGNQNRGEREHSHAHKHPSQIDDFGHVHVQVSFCRLGMNHANSRSVEQSTPKTKHTAYQHQNAFHRFPFVRVIRKPGEIYNATPIFFIYFGAEAELFPKFTVAWEGLCEFPDRDPSDFRRDEDSKGLAGRPLLVTPLTSTSLTAHRTYLDKRSARHR